MLWFGRARRRQYWMRTILCAAIWLICGIALLRHIFENEEPLINVVAFHSVMLVAAFFDQLFVSIRRLHDMNKSGFWVALYFILMMVPGFNVVVALISVAILGFCDGTPGANQFGDDPKGRTMIGCGYTAGGKGMPMRGRRIVRTVIRKDVPKPTTVKPATPETILGARLAKLNDLLQQGLLTEEEYNDRRKRIIDGIQ